MPKGTSKEKTQNRKAVRKTFSESEVGVLLEDLDHKMDLLLEAVSSQESRIDKIEDKIMVIEDKLIRLESVVASLANTVAKNTQNIQTLQSEA